MKESVWTQTVHLPQFPPLESDTKTDILILGGGLAGLLCARRLTDRGVDCLVVEADRVGCGTSGHTTAKITSQHGLIYDKLAKKLGDPAAKAYWQVNQEALGQYCRMAREIPCDFQEKDNYIFSTLDQAPLERELSALSRLGIPGEFAQDLPLPIPTAGAVRFRDQAQFHPRKFLAGILPGLKVREKTRALELQGNRVRTARGWVQAEKILVCTHFPIFNRRGLYFMKMYQSRSYVLALEGTEELPGMYLDGAGGRSSFRSHCNTLLLGDGGHRTGKPGRGWETLEDFARVHYPTARKICRWAAQDCMTLDDMPYIGPYFPGSRGLYVATGFHKWGMTGAMAASMVLADQVMGVENPYGWLFDPARRMAPGPLMANILESAVNLLRPTAPRCTHLGCALKWNPWEHSWDCPCHGSRYGEDGQILDGPGVWEKSRRRP